ncbi:MAG: type IV secretion system DNA-binding domain-containing protein [bacterium]|nr:type IV secretion system DNA-binding domain-containing protein [bacterium]
MANEQKVTYFGATDSRGRHIPFGIKSHDRSRHMYVIGKTGMGKSTLLENMAIQDIRNGNGICFVDPHGKTADLLLDYVPEERIKDVLYFAPFDMEYPVSFNIMEDIGADRRHLVVSGLMATFEKIWVDAWSARMAYILQNTLLALLEYPGSTLLGVNRMLVDKEYRRLVVANITDPSVRSFWVDEFAKYTDRYTQEATPAIQNKVGQFTANPLIRNIVGQPNSTFNLRKMMDEKKIIIINLSKGKVGEGNANLLGSMLITKIYLAAMSRADVTESVLHRLPDLYLYVDEFQSFANKSFADILSEARKYKLDLTLAHQYIEQMEEEVRPAVFGNVGTMAVFRVGAFDAELLEKEFAPAIMAEDLVNLGIYQVYLKLMIDGVTSSPFSAVTLPPIERPPRSFREEILASSRAQFARPRSVVEEEIRIWHAPIPPKVLERKDPVSPRVDSGAGARAYGPSSGAPKTGTPRTDAPLPVREERREFREAPPPRREERREENREAFRQAAPPEERPPAAPVRERPPVSLSQLQPTPKRAERPPGAHLNELRKALSDVLKDAPVTSAGPAETASAPTREAPTASSEQGIPDDMLRKLLMVEKEPPSSKPTPPLTS